MSLAQQISRIDAASSNSRFVKALALVNTERSGLTLTSTTLKTGNETIASDVATECRRGAIFHILLWYSPLIFCINTSPYVVQCERTNEHDVRYAATVALCAIPDLSSQRVQDASRVFPLSILHRRRPYSRDAPNSLARPIYRCFFKRCVVSMRVFMIYNYRLMLPSRRLTTLTLVHEEKALRRYSSQSRVIE